MCVQHFKTYNTNIVKAAGINLPKNISASSAYQHQKVWLVLVTKIGYAEDPIETMIILT